MATKKSIRKKVAASKPPSRKQSKKSTTIAKPVQSKSKTKSAAKKSAKKAGVRKPVAAKKSAAKKSVAKKAKGKKAPAKKQAKKQAQKQTHKQTKPQAKKAVNRRAVLENSAEGPEPRLSEQSGDMQGLSHRESANSESVDELMEEGNAFEAGVVAGVEEAEDSDEMPVHTHEVPEDDVPGEYLDDEE